MPDKRHRPRDRRTHSDRDKDGGKKGDGKGGGLSRYMDPSESLKGRDMVRAARKLASLQVRPQVKAYGRLAQELRGQRSADELGLQRLGAGATSTVQGTYRDLATSQAENIARQSALGNMLQGNVRGTTDRANQAYAAQAQSLQAPGQGQAQQALAAIVAQQKAGMTSDAAASQNFAASQAGSFQGLQNAMNAASQSQGAGAVAGIQRDIASRVAESSLKYGQDIREAMGQKATAKSLKGATALEKLLGLRESERDYTLGKAATRLDKQSLAAETRDEDLRRAETHRANVADEQNAARDDRRQGSERSGDRRQNQREQNQERSDIQAAMRTGRDAVHHWPPKTRQERAEFAEYVQSHSGGASPRIVREMVRRFLQRR